MPPPFEARDTFSFQTRWMPSSESWTEFRKQEMGRPRFAPPFDSTGVEGMNQSLDM